MQANFEGIWIAIVTPYRGDEIDHGALARLSQHLAEQGATGFVAGGTTGEGVLVTTPTYLRPTQRDIQRHFEAIVEAADLPVLVYNSPCQTGINVELETLKALARDARVVGVKEGSVSNERILRLLQETPLRVLCGDDRQNFTALRLGAHGVISASAHVLTRWHVLMRDLIGKGRIVEARSIAETLMPLIDDLLAKPNPAPLKVALAAEGWCSPRLRLPYLGQQASRI